MKNLYYDFEFKNSANKDMDLVCMAWSLHGGATKQTVWLYNEPIAQQTLARYLHMLYEEGYRFCGYSEAEARCTIQLWEQHDLAYDFNKWRYVDLMLEYRMLLNQWNKYMYGEQLIKGKVMTTKPKPMYQTAQRDTDDLHHKPEYGLAAACFKLLGKKIDVGHKTDVIGLILDNSTYTEEEKDTILDYCESDILYLEELYTEIIKILKSKLPQTTLATEIFRRGEYSARTAKMVRDGYPINEPLIRKFTASAPAVLRAACEDVNVEVEGFKPFQWNKKQEKYVRKEKVMRDWILDQNTPNWPKTDTGRLSLSKEAFENYYNSRSEGLGGKYLKYLWTISSMNGFLPRKVEKNQRRTFWDYVGNDGRVRPHFNIYGAQTGRSQPASTGFLPLKSYWMRAFIVPPIGRMCVTIDYGQQEFLIAALKSGDSLMMKAYESSDPYLYFAKLDGAIPKDGTKQTHSQIRDIYKTSVLSILFNMGAKGLAYRLTNELGKTYTEAQAEKLIDSFKNTFHQFSDWSQDYVESYFSRKGLAKVKIPCGWVLWGNQRNWRSVANFPVQGEGSSIMRKAVGFAQDAGLTVIYTLHDALTIECELNDWGAVDKLHAAMAKGFKFYFPTTLLKHANCRLDANAWSPELTEGYTVTECGVKVPQSPIYLDKRGEADYNKYSKLLN